MRQTMGIHSHPSSNPDFDAKREHEIWYLAHPLADDEHFSFAENMAHVVKLMRIFYEEGWYVVAPYHTICCALDDDNAEWRRIGLEVDCNVVRKLGRLVLTGHKLSSGMKNELLSCLDVPNSITHSFIGFTDNQIRIILRELKNVRAVSEEV